MAAEQDTPSSSPSSSSSSQPPTTTQPASPKSPEAKRQLTNLPRLFVVRGPVGLTPSVDERCFTYCSQSVKGRSEGKDPWCRSLCWRRVHKHEVKGNPVPLAPNPTPPRSRANAGSSGPPPSLVNVSTLNGETDGKSDGQRPQESWEEGRYIWYSKGKGSAQVRLEHMRHDVRQMEQWRAAWREKEKKETQEREAKARARAAQVAQAAASTTQAAAPPPPKSLRQIGAENMAAAQVEKRRAAAAAAAAQARRQDQETTLIPVASLPSVIRAELSRRWDNLLKPSRLLISTVMTQAAGGSYGRATDKIWQNVTTGQALKLLDKVARKIEKVGEELDEEDRKAGGNGAQSTK